MSPASGLSALIDQLRDDLAFRRLRQGMATLASHRELILSLEPGVRNSGVLLGLVAQWVDAGFDRPDLIRQLLRRYDGPCRASLPLTDYLHVRMAEGMLSMAEEEFDAALLHFRFIHSLEHEQSDQAELLAISNFWAARCLRRTGRYDDALSYAVRGREIALSRGFEPMAAIMQVLESWLAFQKGRLKEAACLLQQAESVLRDTDDYVSRGNIQSAYGRIARRQGSYEQALHHFECSIAEYGRRDPRHLNVARSLVNIAFVERLAALRAQREIDRELAVRRRDAVERATPDTRARRAQVESRRISARRHLDEALEIYARHQHHHGIGSVSINSGLLHLDSGDLESASGEAAESYRQGEEKHDSITMARARILQCTIENARLEEQIGGHPAEHAQLAARFAQEAVDHARKTQNRRLLARACVWQGLSYAGDYLQNRDEALRCLNEARTLLKTGGHDREPEWDDLAALEAKLRGGGGIDETLREWSQGITGDKSFQQITDEFAAVIIPKVWEREERKVSRVAARLAISPKKVRRILIAAGLLRRG
jgi:tetratricopeptide (TPR) repeat protein